MVGLPNTDPVIDDVAGVEFIARRAREPIIGTRLQQIIRVGLARGEQD
jgi:dihydroorotase-like cyclic amidohydrolase